MIKYTLCNNGMTVYNGCIKMDSKQCGVFGIKTHNSPPERTIIVSNCDVAEKIANILIEDFGGELEHEN